jgi:hypothetical protein
MTRRTLAPDQAAFKIDRQPNKAREYRIPDEMYLDALAACRLIHSSQREICPRKRTHASQ